jgi:hypothetical protein
MALRANAAQQPARSARGAQPDLLDWQPPAPVARFDEPDVRASSIAGRISRAVATTLRDSADGGTTRADIAQRMSAWLEQDVSENMLNAYASQAREDHVISLVRFVALIEVTRDRRLLEMLAERFGWTVIDKKFLPLIDLASIRAREDALRLEREAIVRECRRGGAL